MERISYLFHISYFIFITIIVCSANNQSNISVNSNFALNQSDDQVTLIETENVIIDGHINDASNVTDELIQIFNDEPINQSRVSTNSVTQDHCIDSGTKNGQPELFANYFPEDDKIADYRCFKGEKGQVKLYQKDAYKPETVMINLKKAAMQSTITTTEPIFMDKQVKYLISR